MSTHAIVLEREVLGAAHNGDQDAFRHIVEAHRTALLAHCYRMLGSLPDAEDALQETFLRAWRGLPGFDGRGPLRKWLYRIATNACLDAIADRSKGVPQSREEAPEGAPGAMSPDAPWMHLDQRLGVEQGDAAPDAHYERRESVELAFVTAFRHLPPRQRAVLVLREVLGFSAKEVSQSLGTTVFSVNSALQRARKAVDERVPEKSQQATVRALGDPRVHAIVERFVDAFERGDVDTVVELLAEDTGKTMRQSSRTRAVHFLRSEQPSELAA
jgi:RNA polymerase sigma-70 factor (ECF subfamily)